MVLNGHSLAEEIVLYPAFADLNPDQLARAFSLRPDELLTEDER